MAVHHEFSTVTNLSNAFSMGTGREAEAWFSLYAGDNAVRNGFSSVGFSDCLRLFLYFTKGLSVMYLSPHLWLDYSIPISCFRPNCKPGMWEPCLFRASIHMTSYSQELHLFLSHNSIGWYKYVRSATRSIQGQAIQQPAIKIQLEIKLNWNAAFFKGL